MTEKRGNKEAPPDRSQIGIDAESEVNYWIGELGVTQEQLEDALRAVGPSPTDVRAYLNQLSQGAAGG